jgi:dipicolinate synthase subunit A
MSKGKNFDAAEKHGIRVIKAPSLPGRISPKSAGEAIARILLNIEKGTVCLK